MTTAVALQLLIAGLSIGSIYALVALGLVIVFKGTGVLNFAQGELVTLGAYLALFLSVLTKLPYAAVFILTVLLAAAAGYAIERDSKCTLIRAPAFTVVIATLAIGLMIKNALRLAWQEPVSSLPTPFSSDPIVLGAVRVNPQYLWVIGCTLLLLAVMAAFFRMSRLGKAMRAVSENQEAARLMGVPVGRIFSLTFAFGTAIAATAGILFAPLTGIEAEIGTSSSRASSPLSSAASRPWPASLSEDFCSGFWKPSAAPISAAFSRTRRPSRCSSRSCCCGRTSLFGRARARRV